MAFFFVCVCVCVCGGGGGGGGERVFLAACVLLPYVSGGGSSFFVGVNALHPSQ